ncbi:MAG: cytochrome c3 family protein [Planctomycetes bacterium]|nr:cytochrome c3 family protein [Planctomycetota bacterium]MCB9888131.1 cytochrome c3 family protein [Planctomycetota bacterium]
MNQLFPKWTNRLPAVATVLAVLGAPTLVFMVWYYFSPWYLEVGYAPDQPVPYNHKLHAGMFGMDCRYCHQNVERGPHATVPPTQTCMNCHVQVKKDSPLLAPVRASFEALAKGESDRPVPWIKVHMLPDYAYFDHSVHVTAGVGCISCHGRVDQMEVVRQEKPLSMGWCLECHRDPAKHVRPVSEITNMNYRHDEALAKKLIAAKKINPPTHCSACHR